ncbi:response regulator [Neptunomonas antarctica]|uniref:Two-component system, OmpR family, response regulator n=1 Tax=Neptunomonas antarctica TaxID=619304 RepID=A0A1N7LJK7_9GAMM|nr:response regulator [Neptunomonas antarctica]SIS73931.1 two-component system, OmpR family, response regulator [Neptunomonas antarctica]
MRILLVEDDPLIGQAIEQALQDAALTVDWVQDGETALSAINTEEYALLLLDLGLPEKDGFEVLRLLRHNKNSVPVIIITARDAVEDRIKGLDYGADDYLVKPFSIDELQARIRAVIRRNHGNATPLLGNDILTLDPASREVSRDSTVYTLSSREYALLHALMLRPGSILSRAELEERIYGWNEEVASNAIEFIIHGLRKKLGKDAIKNVRGLGWMVSK